MSFVVAAAIGGTAALGGAWLGASASRSAARQQMQAINEAKGQITSSYREAQGYYTPYEEAGAQGLNQLRNLMEYKPMTLADMQLDPGYQFRLSQGLKTLQRNAAARGGTLSGQTLTGIQNYAQNAASEEYGNAFNRYLTNRQEQLRLPMYFANVGGQVATNKANLASEYGNNLASLVGAGGRAQAAGTMGEANAWSQGLGAITNMVGGYITAKAGKD